MLKNRNCGELRTSDAESTVSLTGWVHRRRDHGGLIFIDLRDRSGIVQVVFNPEAAPEAHGVAESYRSEWVVSVTGVVAGRPADTENPRMATGEVEVLVAKTDVLSPAKTPPFYINEETPVDESLRLEYRYLDLRKERMQRNLSLRHRVIKYIRDYLDAQGFIEIETPMLIKSTPEGARDYLVPSRVSPGNFYALPQSPQQLKQLLMVAGFERYFQIARCFRDEDLRADRQPEFTQLDLEMSFVDEDDVLELMEQLFESMVKEVAPEFKVARPVPRLTYAEAMSKYGSDKPDLRFALELVDISREASETDLGVFRGAIEQGGVVKGFAAPGCAGYTRKQLDELTEMAKSRGAKGLVTIGLGAASSLDAISEDEIRSNVAKFLTVEQVIGIGKQLSGNPGDLLLIIADDSGVADLVLGYLREEMGRRLSLCDPDTLAFAFIVDFPLLQWNSDEGRWDSTHHPFTSMKDEDFPLLDTNPGAVRSKAYDMVCNGLEFASGSIRIHDSALQSKIFHMLGYSQEQIDQRFGHLLKAFEYGVPPHGGIAYGLDRVVMVLAREESIREVIAFPKTQSAADLLMGAPSAVDGEQLKDLHLHTAD